MADSRAGTPENEDLIGIIFGAADAGLCLLDSEGVVIRANAGWLRSMALEAKDALGRPYATLDPPRADLVREACSGEIGAPLTLPPRSSGAHGTYEDTAITVPLETSRGVLLRTRERVPSSIRATASVAPQGSAAGIGRVEGNSREEEFRALSTALDALPIGIIVMDVAPEWTAQVVAQNEAHARIVGVRLERGAILSPSHYRIFGADRVTPIPPRDLPGARAALGGESVGPVILHGLRQDGDWRVLEVSAAPCDGAGPGFRRAVVVTLDITARFQAEQDLRSNEATYRAAFENIGDAVTLIQAIRGRDGAIEDWLVRDTSESVCDLLGRTREELVGKKLKDVLPDRVSALDANFRRVLSTRAPWQYEARVGDRDFFVKIFCIDAETLGSTAMDITDRKAMDVARRRNEERLRQLVEHTPAAIALFDRDLRYVAVSKRFAIDYRVDPDAILGRLHYEVFPEVPEHWRAAHARCLAGAVERGSEDAFTRADGRIDWVDWEVRPWHDSDGSIGGIVLFSVVVTERKLAADRLLAATERVQRSRAELFALVEKLPLGLFVTNRGAIVYANPAFADYVGRRAADLVGCPPESLAIDGVSSPEQGKEWVVRGSEGRAVTLECGSVRELEFYGRAAHLWTCRDLTQLKAMQAQLIHGDRLATVGLLAAGVAHEINNPLTYVITALDLVEEALNGLENARTDRRLLDVFDSLRDAHEGALRVKAIVRDLKAFSRTDADERTELDLSRVLDTAISMATTEIKHRARISRSYEPVPSVVGNEARLGQVFLNLLVNAAHAIPEGRAEENEIQVWLRSDTEGRAVVEVHDTGTGISREAKSRIFQPFFTTKRGIGTGLGLAISRSTISALGGEITLDDRPAGGTIARVVLPPGKLLRAVSAASSLPAPAATSARVLVVDDEASICKMFQRMLSEHQVFTETRATEAWARIQRGECFDVIFCDLMMPDMTGMDLHARLAERAPEQAQRMVFITGGTFTNTAKDFLARVTNARIDKPFDVKQIRAIVGRC